MLCNRKLALSSGIIQFPVSVVVSEEINRKHYLGILPDIGLAVRVFANGPGDLGSIPGSSHTKDSKNGT